MASQRTQLLTLKRLLYQAELILSDDAANARCRELLSAASALTSDLLKQDKMPAAAALGQRGGWRGCGLRPDHQDLRPRSVC